MRHGIVVLLTGVVLLSLGTLTGCSGSYMDESLKSNDPFPECLVGVWKSDNFGWAFKFEPDGSIKKIRHMLAREVNLDEGAVEMQGPEEGTYALYVMGDCQSNYEPKTRTLKVIVVLEHYEMVLPNGVLEGNSVDIFTGQISKDCKTWNVEWNPRGWLKGSDPIDPEIMDANVHSLVFTKLELDKAPDHSEEKADDSAKPHDHQ